MHLQSYLPEDLRTEAPATWAKRLRPSKAKRATRKNAKA